MNAASVSYSQDRISSKKEGGKLCTLAVFMMYLQR